MAKKKFKKEAPLLKVIILIAALLGIVFFLQTFLRPAERRVEAGPGDIITLNCFNYSVSDVVPYPARVMELDLNGDGTPDTISLQVASGLSAHWPVGNFNLSEIPILPFGIAGPGSDSDTADKIVSVMWYKIGRINERLEDLEENYLGRRYEPRMIAMTEQETDEEGNIVLDEDGELVSKIVLDQLGNQVMIPALDNEGNPITDKVFPVDLMTANDALLIARGSNYGQYVYQFRHSTREKYRLQYLLNLFVATQGDIAKDKSTSFTDCWRLGEIMLDLFSLYWIFPIRPMIEDFYDIKNIFPDLFRERGESGSAGGSGSGLNPGGDDGDTGDDDGDTGGDTGGGGGIDPGGNGGGTGGAGGSGDSGSGDSGSGDSGSGDSGSGDSGSGDSGSGDSGSGDSGSGDSGSGDSGSGDSGSGDSGSGDSGSGDSGSGDSGSGDSGSGDSGSGDSGSGDSGSGPGGSGPGGSPSF